MMFIGRTTELALLKECYQSEKSELVVLYGRRRVGKSSVIHHFGKEKPQFFFFEALERANTQEQIKHFAAQLKNQTNDIVLDNARFKDWESIFFYLSDRIIKSADKRPKLILFFDELQWMAAGREKLVSLLKFFWDNHWKDNNVMLILCGSIASFMIKKVIRSKALYGRITLEILLQSLKPAEAVLLFRNKRSQEEMLKYLLVFGSIPKYLEEINLNRSFHQNMNRLCFSQQGLMTQEIEKIFYSQFKETKTYLKIIKLLKNGIYTFKEISKKLGLASGGGLKSYLENLEQAEIIRSYIPFDKNINSKFRKYTLSDEYILFYFKYIEPNLRSIQASQSTHLFETLSKDSFAPWLGFAFERFCIKYAGILSDIMGFKDEVLIASPFFGKESPGFQIDLMYKRADKTMTICEIKHKEIEIGTNIIPEMEKKLSLVKIPRGYTVEKALISLYGPKNSLKEAGYFNHFVTLDEIMN